MSNPKALCSAIQAPDTFRIKFDTDVKGGEPIIMNITRAWAPLGVDHFYELNKVTV